LISAHSVAHNFICGILFQLTNSRTARCVCVPKKLYLSASLLLATNSSTHFLEAALYIYRLVNSNKHQLNCPTTSIIH
jgi:hypothetical protein